MPCALSLPVARSAAPRSASGPIRTRYAATAPSRSTLRRTKRLSLQLVREPLGVVALGKQPELHRPAVRDDAPMRAADGRAWRCWRADGATFRARSAPARWAGSVVGAAARSAAARRRGATGARARCALAPCRGAAGSDRRGVDGVDCSEAARRRRSSLPLARQRPAARIGVDCSGRCALAVGKIDGVGAQWRSLGAAAGERRQTVAAGRKHLRHEHHDQRHQDRRAGQSLFEATFHHALIHVCFSIRAAPRGSNPRAQATPTPARRCETNRTRRRDRAARAARARARTPPPMLPRARAGARSGGSRAAQRGCR